MTLISTLRWRPVLIAASVLVVFGALLAVPSARTLADDVLGVFRVKRFAIVTFDPNQPQRNFLDLSQFGTMQQATQGGRSRSVASADEAGKAAGVAIRLPRDPALGTPQFAVFDGSTATFTFDVAKARAYLAARGETGFQVPDQFDGAKLTFTMPAMVIATYGNAGGRGNSGAGVMQSDVVVVMQGQSPTARVEGRVTLEDLRRLLLAMPGIPPDVAAQLRAIDDWTNTLPIPVPRGLGVTQEVRVNGSPGIAIADNTGAGGGVVWTRDNLVFAVAGARTAPRPSGRRADCNERGSGGWNGGHCERPTP